MSMKQGRTRKINPKTVLLCGFPQVYSDTLKERFSKHDCVVESHYYAADTIKNMRVKKCYLVCLYGSRYEVEWMHMITRISTDVSIKKSMVLLFCENVF